MVSGTSRVDAITVKRGKRRPPPTLSYNQRSTRECIEGENGYLRSRERSPAPSSRQREQFNDYGYGVNNEPTARKLSSLEISNELRAESQTTEFFEDSSINNNLPNKGNGSSPESTVTQQESTDILRGSHAKTDTFILKQAAAERIIKENERSISGARKDMELLTVQEQERRVARVAERAVSSKMSQGAQNMSHGALRGVGKNITPKKTSASKKRTPTSPNAPPLSSSARHTQRPSLSSQRHSGKLRRVSTSRSVYATPTRITASRPRVPMPRIVPSPSVKRNTPLGERILNRHTPPNLRLPSNVGARNSNEVKSDIPRASTKAKQPGKSDPLEDISGLGASKKTTGRNWLRRRTLQPPNTDDSRQENVKPTANKRNSGFVNTISTWLKSDKNTTSGQNERRSSTAGSIFGTASRAASRLSMARCMTPQPQGVAPESVTPLNANSPDEHFKISQEDVERLVNALESKQPLKKDRDGFTTLDGRYYSKNVPTLEESPSKEDKEQNPVAVCMRLIEEARTEPDRQLRDKMMALCILYVDTVAKTADTQTKYEETVLCVSFAEESYRGVMDHAKKLENAVLDSRLLAIRAERSALDAQETLLQTAKLIRSWRADSGSQMSSRNLGRNAGESQQA